MKSNSNLRELRQAAGLSMAVAAASLGLSVSQLSRIERGISSANSDQLGALQRLYGCSAAAVIGQEKFAFNTNILQGKQILLIISGGIAAYKSLELIRRLKERGASVRCVLTKGGAQFVTPLAVSALAEEKVYQELWSLNDEAEMGHIRLSREADLVVIAPASANLLARMAAGMADDLASTVLLASDKQVLAAPAMNVMMWQHPATLANIRLLQQRGVRMIGPASGDMACGEVGAGRMVEVPEIIAAIEEYFLPKPLAGRHAIVTAGPTIEAIDPVRVISNRSSGKQGYAIAAALARAGARVSLISGPVALPCPDSVTRISVESAEQMLAACLSALPADIFIASAAVADWKVANPAREKQKKQQGAPQLEFAANPDILASIAQLQLARPSLVIGFAAETAPLREDLLALASAKRQQKKCDWLLANNVSQHVFGSDSNEIFVLDENGSEHWPRQPKDALAEKLVARVIGVFGK